MISQFDYFVSVVGCLPLLQDLSLVYHYLFLLFLNINFFILVFAFPDIIELRTIIGDVQIEEFCNGNERDALRNCFYALMRCDSEVVKEQLNTLVDRLQTASMCCQHSWFSSIPTTEYSCIIISRNACKAFLLPYVIGFGLAHSFDMKSVPLISREPFDLQSPNFAWTSIPT